MTKCFLPSFYFFEINELYSLMHTYLITPRFATFQGIQPRRLPHWK